MTHNNSHTPNGGHGAPHLQHHFSSLRQQYESTKLGMWLFLVTEILLFGGLFCVYAVYRANRPEIFVYGHKYLDARLGAINTAILICSSLTMALAVRSAQLGRRRPLIALLTVTILCGFGFLGIKYVEYDQKWKHGLLWGKYYRPPVAHEQEAKSAAPATPETTSEAAQPSAGETQSLLPPPPPGPQGLVSQSKNGPKRLVVVEQPKNVQTFFAVYFAMTGLHGIHVLVGILLISWLVVLSAKGRFSSDNFTAVDLVGLYWHLVDLIWIYLFPLFYLIR